MILNFNIFQPYADKIEQGVVRNLQDIPGAVLANQVHEDLILELHEKPKTLPHCDAFMTTQKGLPLMIKVADCQGILIYDPEHEAIAAVHSGWRGSSLNILGKTIHKMKKRYGSDPKKLLVAISPSLGPCCAEFSDPTRELPEFCRPFTKENNHVDFWAISQQQGQFAGVPASQIEVSKKCTKCQPGYYSHRNGDSQRLGVFVKLR